AITPETAAWVAEWADALITIAHPPGELREVVDAFRGAGGGGRPIFLQAQHAFAPTLDEALRGAHAQWGTNILPSRVLSDLRMPSDFEAAARYVREEDLAGPVRVSADPGQHLEWIQRDLEMGI